MKTCLKLVLGAVLGCALFHMMLTGSPVPMWHIEALENPRQVVEVTDNAILMDDGNRLALPFIKTLPAEHAVFLEALAEGVEVDRDGEVIGLLRVKRICSNDPVVYSKLRVNLSDLAGVLNPSGIDNEIVTADAIEFAQELYTSLSESVRIDAYLLLKMRGMRRLFQNTRDKPLQASVD